VQWHDVPGQPPAAMEHDSDLRDEVHSL